MSLNTYIPFVEAIDIEFIPAVISDHISGSLSKLAYEEGLITGEQGDRMFAGRFRVVEEFVLNIPLAEDLAFVLGDGLINVSVGYYQDEFSAYLVFDLLKLRIPRNWLQPVILDADGEYIADPDATNFVEFILPIGLTVNQDFNLEAILPGTGLGAISIPLCMIGNSGLILEATGLQIDLSSSTNISPATEEGRSDNFKGIFIEQGTIVLPNSWTDNQESTSTPPVIIAENFLIGSEGGVSGTITLVGNGNLKYNFPNGIEVELNPSLPQETV